MNPLRVKVNLTFGWYNVRMELFALQPTQRHSLPAASGKPGFTLIELSIVLVIIGLIVGGILVGRDLIHAAEMRRVESEVDAIKTAMQTFRLKYNCLPGDCPEATKLFGASVINGNGDGQLIWFNEGYQAWQHLALAELVAGKFSGVGAGGGVIGVNIPGSKFNNGGYTIIYTNGIVGSSLTGDVALNRLMLGQAHPGSYAVNSIMSGRDNYMLDSKYDDGWPTTGTITVQSSSATCATIPGDSVFNRAYAYYNKAGDTITCTPIFALGL